MWLTDWLNAHTLFWPVFIFCARVVDVSIGTMRTIFVVRGYRAVSALLGLIEVMVWIVAVSGVLREQLTGVKVLAWGCGFATGNACGIWIEQKLALGRQVVRLISRQGGRDFAKNLRSQGFMVTEVPAYGRDGQVALCFVVVRRDQTQELLSVAQKIDPDVYVTVEDVQHTTFTTDLDGHVTTGWRSILKKK